MFFYFILSDNNSSDYVINGGHSHNHKIDLSQIICNKELVYKAPAFTLLACLDKQPDKYDKPEMSNVSHLLNTIYSFHVNFSFICFR